MKTNIAPKQMLACLLLLAALASSRLEAQTVPPLINYQGRLVNSNNLPLPTGDYELRFSLWDAATGGTQVWGPQVFNGQTGPGLGPKVPVVQGWFNVMLGPSDTNGASLVNPFTGADRFLEIQVGANPPLSPRQQILTAPYAIKAERANEAGYAANAGQAQTANQAQSSRSREQARLVPKRELRREDGPIEQTWERPAEGVGGAGGIL